MTTEQLKALGIEKTPDITGWSMMPDGSFEPDGFWEYVCPSGHRHSNESAAVECVEASNEHLHT